MLISLILGSVSAQHAFGPLMTKLYSNRQVFSGNWELSNETLYNSSTIILSPANSTTGFGYAWRLKRPPNNTWDATFRFHISNPKELAQVCVFLTEDFGASGKCFGGPCKYFGVAVISEIFNNTLSFEFRKNDGKINFSGSSIIPSLTFPFTANEFSIKIENLNINYLRVYANVMGQNSIIHMGKTHVEVEKNWLAITSNNNKTQNEICMKYANISFQDEMYTFDDEDTEANQKSDTLPYPNFDPNSRLNHLEFEKISKVIVSSAQKTPVFTDTNSVLDCVGEFGKVLNNSIRLKPAIEVIETALHFYTDSWKRRAYKMINQSQELKDEVEKQLSSTQKAFDLFRTTVINDFSKLESLMSDIEFSLKDNIRNSSKIIDYLRKRQRLAHGSKFVRFIAYLSIVEVVVTIVTIAKMLKPSRM